MSSAEWNCHNVLDWPLPAQIIDTFTEFRNISNHVSQKISSSLLNACKVFDIPTISSSEKLSARNRILEGPPFSEEDNKYILDYCESDIKETVDLFRCIVSQPNFHLKQALYRGQFMKVCSSMELAGIPVDVGILYDLKKYWPKMRLKIIQKRDNLGVYEGSTFKQVLLEELILNKGWDWPVTETGMHYRSDKETLKTMAQLFPEIEPLRILRSILSNLNFENIMVGSDGRSRTSTFPFWTKTGRNSPQDSEYKKARKEPRSRFIFGLPSCLRGLVKPEPGKALVYLDYSQQEFFIAAVLSGDKNMEKIYCSGDPYITFAILAKVVPETATKQSHPKERELYKKCMLAAQYGIGPQALGIATGTSTDVARELLKKHHQVFSEYWKWREKTYTQACLYRSIQTSFGWNMRVESSGKLTICNFPVQATGAEILRVACIKLYENDIKILAPVHDAVLIECLEENIENDVLKAQVILGDASEIVLGAGNRLKIDTKIIRYPDRFLDDSEENLKTWNIILEALEEVKQEENFNTF